MSVTIPEVRSVHHVHVWQIGEKRLMTLHVQVVPPHDHDALLGRIQAYLLDKYRIGHATIQMEYGTCNTPDCLISDSVTEEGHSHLGHSHAHHHH
ncbi:Co/Zn/Cd efflux system component [Ewingella americana]